MSRPTNLVIRIPFLIALLVLIANDHLLKALYPSLITGKLSDFSGLFMFPVFMVAVFGRWISSDRALLWLHLAVGFCFILWKLAPVELLLNSLGELTSWPMPSRVMDATDLMALVMLPISYSYVRLTEQKHRLHERPSLGHRLVVCLVLIASGWAVMATTLSWPMDGCCEGIRGDANGDGIIDISDIAMIVEYVHHNGPRPACIEEADVDGSADKNPITDTDIAYLSKYIFENGPPPPDCLEWRGGPEL